MTYNELPDNWHDWTADHWQVAILILSNITLQSFDSSDPDDDWFRHKANEQKAYKISLAVQMFLSSGKSFQDFIEETAV